ncbi:MAG: helix-turn-helix domain-containing protein [Planctomycetes bacterium]|nr:helix-turn-helix domain-containing protein [Planctomycetota bacterium]
MYIHGFFVTLQAREPAAQHTHDNHEFYLSLDGHCQQTAGAATFAMGAGEVCLLPQGVPHYAYARGAATTAAGVVNVDESFFAASHDGDREGLAMLQCLCQRARAGGYLLPLAAAGKKAARAAVTEMAEETAARAPGWQTLVKCAFLRLVCTLYRECPECRASGALPAAARRERMRDVFAHIGHNYMTPLMVDDLLPIAHLSRSHFHAVFAAEAGCTFKTYLNRVRTAHAERLLRETDLPVAQIALGCGFNCLSQFYAVFKEVTGSAPSRRRRAARDDAARDAIRKYG